METLTLRPSEIRYSQDSIGCRLSDGTPLTCVFAHLISGSLKATDLPGIKVLSMNGHWWTVTGNRSLFLTRKLEEVGVVEKISVRKSSISSTSDLFKRKFTNVCGGKKVSCRQKFLQSSLNEIVSDWQSGRDVVAKWDPFNKVRVVVNSYREDSNHDGNEECQGEDDQYYHDEGDDYYGEQYDRDEQEGQGYYEQYDREQYDRDEQEGQGYYANANSNQEHTDAYDDHDDYDDYFSRNEDEKQDEDEDKDASICNVM